MRLRQQVQMLRRCRITYNQLFLRAISFRNTARCFWCSSTRCVKTSAVPTIADQRAGPQSLGEGVTRRTPSVAFATLSPERGHISRATASKMASSFEAQFGCTFKTAARYGPTVETGPNESLEI